MAERGEHKFDVWKFRDHKRKARVPKLLPPMYGQKSGGWGTSPRTPPASQETPPTPTTSAFLLLPRPSLPVCLACLLPSSWRAACWEPVAIETRPRRMLQDPGKRDALVCSLQQALCPNPHPESMYLHCLLQGHHLGVSPVLPWSRLASPPAMTLDPFF